MFRRFAIKFIVLSSLLCALPLFAQGFGQNKVQYKEFDWHFLQTEHFDIYFYPGSYDIAVFAANVGEDAYKLLKRDFNYELAERVSIILYKSHNDFQQTNVVNVYLSEGIGGVTELFKNRVVVPFEGSWEQFRHVIHHELVHAVMNDMLYGGSIQSLVSGQVAPVPLWFSEGLAEYLSLRWDTKLDMVVRDATITGYLPSIPLLNYYLAYQGGASLFRYIAEKYGNEKIGEILHKIKGSFRFDSAFKSALGIDLEELSENWRKEMRKEYWPDIADRQETGDFARALTDHKETRSFLNISPALSPSGDKLAFLSNMGGKQSIYVMDVLNPKEPEKIIQGETDVDFEELHWLSPGMGWSPDATRIALSAKAGDQDALYVYDVFTEETKQFKFGLDGIFSAAWSPAGEQIAFIGNINGASDVYIYDVRTEELQRLTDDMFSDSYPAWSQDGKKIAFVSDRGQYLSMEEVPEDFKISTHQYLNHDIYFADVETGEITRVTDTENFNETDPVFSPDGNKMLYVSDRNGIYNIYVHDLKSAESYPISNLLTGAFQLSIDKSGQTLAFSSFSEGGWDVFMVKNPFEMPAQELENTVYFKKLEDKSSLLSTVNELAEEETVQDTLKEKVAIPKTTDFSNYVFADLDRRTQKKPEDITLDEEDYKRDDGNYKVRNYRVKFSPDIVNGQAQYNTLWGFQGFTQIAYSDVLGNHRIYLGTNLVFDLRNSYIAAQYWYLPKRIDYGVNAYHFANTYVTRSTGVTRFRNYGASFIASRPFNKFTRADFSLNFVNAQLEFLSGTPEGYQGRTKVSGLLPSLQLVHDTAEWWYTGPGDGFRGALSITASPKYTESSFEFTTVKTDLRKYVKLAQNYRLAFRYTGGISLGAQPQQFFLGGTENWLNRRFNGGLERRLDSIEEVYFSEFVTPLRGARFYEQIGTRFSLVNAEFRFPLIPYMELGLPPIRFGNIIGVAFTDIGSAWDDNSGFRGVRDGRTEDIFMGYGTGARIFLFGFLLKYDLAWQYDFQNSSRARHYFSIGIDF